MECVALDLDVREFGVGDLDLGGSWAERPAAALHQLGVFGLCQPVRSIAQALALLGVEKLKRWAALTLFASVENKPAELTITALAR